MSTQKGSKLAHELGCLRTAQMSLEGFPVGEVRPGNDPPDCYIAVPDGEVLAFELTEQIDPIAARSTNLAAEFLDEARVRLLSTHPNLRTGWAVSMSPGDIFETIAAEPPNSKTWKEWRKRQRNLLIDRFVSVVAKEIHEPHSFEWRVSGEPIWTFDLCERLQHGELTRIDFVNSIAYSETSRDRIENGFCRNVTFTPQDIQKKIAGKISGLSRYRCRPAYLLISASLFPRSVRLRNRGSFAVLRTARSLVDFQFDVGEFTAVFLHDPSHRSYRIGTDGKVVELEMRSISTVTSMPRKK